MQSVLDTKQESVIPFAVVHPLAPSKTSVINKANKHTLSNPNMHASLNLKYQSYR